jgi:hypothetical protein
VIKPIYQKSTFVVHGRIYRASRCLETSFSQPLSGSLHERTGCFLVVPTLKETKEANPISVIFVVPTIPYGRDPTHRTTFSFCDE